MEQYYDCAPCWSSRAFLREHSSTLLLRSGRMEAVPGGWRRRGGRWRPRKKNEAQKKNFKKACSNHAVFLFGVRGFVTSSSGREVSSSLPSSSSSLAFFLRPSLLLCKWPTCTCPFFFFHQGASGHAHVGVGHLSGTHVHIQGRSKLVPEPGKLPPS